jgi:putative transposase
MVTTWPDTAMLAWALSVGRGMLPQMTRHTTFKFCLDPTVEQHDVLARHTGAARFAFNQCLRMVKTGLTQRRSDPYVEVPWTGFDLINAFNAWKNRRPPGVCSP